MSDLANATTPFGDDTSDPSSLPPASGQKGSPLDVLDEILKEAKDQAGQEAEEQLAAQQAEMAKAQAERRARDQEELQAELSQLSQVKDTPEYQAKVSQKKSEDDQHSEHAQSMKGFEINQLQHTTIQE